ncbi:hypothetical protein KP509_09G051900 [Ceratopteris richardii]|uniref:Ribulose bisphosphate carboxylase small subunit, chloroplastic n=1 Tax=Ceratopteris richardii TaxID=49495 RepID=A0A8T2U194_CERRI|nr:hypothetical protein KP509_09G050600 [Ceratopteris richardii]KAH7429487.1 hypothetical protein KP509_09G051900 [Ceratopteris richardii]
MASISASLAVSAPVEVSTSVPNRAFSGLSKSASFFAPKSVNPLSINNGSRVNAMLVVDPYNNLKYETLSYLPPLTDEQIAKQVDYIIRNGWNPCVEFDRVGSVHRTNFSGSGYYDGRYWIMWKLPMFGCTDSAAVLREIAECAKAHPDSYVRVLGFSALRQVQCAGFLVKKPSV